MKHGVGKGGLKYKMTGWGCSSVVEHFLAYRRPWILSLTPEKKIIMKSKSLRLAFKITWD
jgi:hypothetical protein